MHTKLTKVQVSLFLECIYTVQLFKPFCLALPHITSATSSS